MPINKILKSYYKGIRLIVLAVLIVTLTGVTIDTLIYFETYPYPLKIVQLLCTVAIIIALMFYFANSAKNFKFAYGLAAYSTIAAIIVTTLTYNSLLSSELAQSNVGQRDIFFLVLYLCMSGFVINRKHIILQACILVLTICYYVAIVQNPYFIENSLIYLLVSIAFSCVSYFLVGSINRFIEEFQKSYNELSKVKEHALLKSKKLGNFQETLLKLATLDSLHKKTLDALSSDICRTAASVLNVERVSIWNLENEDKLVRRSLYSSAPENSEEFIILSKEKYPIYLEAVEKECCIAVDNAREDTTTRELKETYFEPLNIYSTLDCLFYIDSTPAGLICCESVGKIKYWTGEDKLFVQALSDFLAIAHKNQLINDLMQQLKSKNNLLELTLSENLELNEELTRLNEELEATVEERTRRLRKQNDQLTEYAFINSHLLRAPIARILGLADLIAREVHAEKDQVLVKTLEHTTHELDLVVRRISEILYDENELTSARVKEIISKNNL